VASKEHLTKGATRRGALMDAAPKGAGASVPTQGELIRARGDVWIATGVSPTRVGDGREQHLVKLLSVSEDRHGETAELIWQVEPGATVLEAVRLPGPAVSHSRKPPNPAFGRPFVSRARSRIPFDKGRRLHSSCKKAP